jgi:hypothetical protein
MHSDGLPSDHSIGDVIEASVKTTLPSFKRSLLLGGIGFSLVSLFVFGTVAFAQRWMYQRLGVTGAYLVWIALFILLGSWALSPLVVGPRRLLRSYALFGAAFLAYGISWMTAYFTLKNAAGEWLGSLAGSVSMALVFAVGFRDLRSVPVLSALLFVTNSIGYFVGSVFYYSLRRPAGLLVWGAFYGACVGAGLSAVFYLAQSKQAIAQVAEQNVRVSDEQG